MRWRDPALCAEQDLEAAQALAAELDRLREDCVAMLAVAAARGVLVPDDLRERLSLGARGLPATRMLHGELAAIVRPDRAWRAGGGVDLPAKGGRAR